MSTVAVPHDEIAFGHDPFDVDAQLRELALEPGDEFDERLGAVGGLWVVLDVLRSDVLVHGVLRPAVVERHGVEAADDFLVALDVGHGCLLS